MRNCPSAIPVTSSTNEGRRGQPEAAQFTKGLVTEGGFFIWWRDKECQGKMIWHLTSSTWGTYNNTMGEEQHCLVGKFSVTVEMSYWVICPDSSSLSCTCPVHFGKITGGCSDVLFEWKWADTEKAQEITNNKLWTWNHALIFLIPRSLKENQTFWALVAVLLKSLTEEGVLLHRLQCST